MAARRDELGGPPTPEELLAYRDGELDPAARQSVEDRLALDPDAARALADLAAFPDIEPDPGASELSDEEVEDRWQTLHKKLQELPARQPASPSPRPAPAPVQSAPVERAPRPPRTSRFPIYRLAAAAVLILAAGLAGFLWGRASRSGLPESGVSVAVALIELSPLEEGGERSLLPAAETAETAETAEEIVLVLGLPAASELPEYRIEILDGRGARVWSGGGLHPTPLGTVQLSIRRGVLPAGTSRLRLLDAADGSPVATYELRLGETPGSP